MPPLQEMGDVWSMLVRVVTRAALGAALAVVLALLAGMVLPRGEQLLYSSVFNWGAGSVQLYTMDVGRGLAGPLIRSRADNLPGLPAQWSPDGEQIAFVVDDRRLETYLVDARGRNPRRLADHATESEYDVLWSPDGRWLAFVGTQGENEDVFVIGPDGDLRRLTHEGIGYRNLAWSPDGRYIAMETGDLSEDVAVVEVDAGILHRLTVDPARDLRPAWSPDGRWIAFLSSRDNGGRGGTRFDVYVANTDCLDRDSDCSQQTRRLTQDSPANSVWQIRWSPDGASILFGSHSWLGDDSIYLITVEDGRARPIAGLSERVASPAWSPDGARMAFEERHAAGWQIVVADSAGSVQRRIQMDGDGKRPQWLEDGSRLAFIANEGRNWDIYVVDVRDGQPQRLTRSRAIDYSPVWRP